MTGERRLFSLGNMLQKYLASGHQSETLVLLESIPHRLKRKKIVAFSTESIDLDELYIETDFQKTRSERQRQVEETIEKCNMEK